MTSPNGAIPSTAYTGTAGGQKVSGVQHETEAQIKAAGRADGDAAYGSARGNIANNLFGGFFNGLIGFISFLVMALKGVTGGLIDLTGLLADTQNTANNAAETAASASNLAAVYNFDVAANTAKYPATPPFSYPAVGYAYSGANVALLQPAAGYPAFATNRLGIDFRITPEEKIYMEWRQRRSGANFQARLNLRVLDANGAQIADMSPAQPTVTATDNVWAKYSGTVTIPAGAYVGTPELKLQLDAGQSPTGSWAFDNVIVRRATEADLSAIEAELAGKANYSDIPTNVPLWQSIVPTDDPVYPDALNVFLTTGNSDGGNYRETKVPSFQTDSGEMDIGFIRCLRDRDYLQVGFQLGRGGLIGAGPFEFFVCVYRVDQQTGDLTTKIWDSGNIKTLVNSVGSGNQVRLNLPQFSAAQGEVLAVGVVQRANQLNPSYGLYGLNKPWTSPPSGYWPRGLHARANTGTNWPPPSSISASSLIWSDDVVPWFFLG